MENKQQTKEMAYRERRAPMQKVRWQERNAMVALNVNESELQFGKYTCQRCEAEYIVNDGTWRICTPEFCHSCTEYLSKQTVLLPFPEPKH